MPWQETDEVRERLRFVHQYESGGFSMTELCARFGISRPTGYTCWKRYTEEGPDGLLDRSRRPKTCPHQTAPELETRHNLGVDFIHPISEVIQAILDAGFELCMLHEHPVTMYPRWPWLETAGDGVWRMPGDRPALPLVYSLLAQAPG